MKHYFSIIVAALCIVGNNGWCADTEKSPLTASEIKNLAQVISDTNTLYSSLAVRVSFVPRTDLFLKYFFFYKKPDQCAVLIVDGRDSTPLLVGNQNGALFYDPFTNALLYCQSKGVLFITESNDRGFFIKAGPYTLSENGTPKRGNKVNIDLSPLLDVMSVDMQASQDQQGRYHWSGQSKKGTRCVATVDPSAAIPFQTMSLFMKGMTNACLVIDRIEANTYIDDSIFSLPLDELRKRELDVETKDGDAIVDYGGPALGKAMVFRAAIALPARRTEAVGFGLTNVNWDEMETRDRKVSAILRDIFPVKDW